MKGIQINVNGKAYPCSPTMGAMLRFKRETGREITEIDANSFSDLCTYLWCCVVSASKRDGVDFDMPLMDVADSITPDDMAEWNEAVSGAQHDKAVEGGGEKKPLGIYDLMGIALGCIRLSLDDFCRLDYDEFESICDAWHENAEAAYRGEWERMRVLAAISIQPHVKKSVTPKKLLPLPWDNALKERKVNRPVETAEERLKRFKALIKCANG